MGWRNSMTKQKQCCESPNLVHAKHKDVLFQGSDQKDEWQEISLDIECIWCANCYDVSFLN